jgi:hypothetical protein
MNESAIKVLEAKYLDAYEKHDAARRAATEARGNAAESSGPQPHVWLLELVEIEAAHARAQLAADINYSDTAVKQLRDLVIDELARAARVFEQGPAEHRPVPLSKATPAAITAKVDLLIANEALRRQGDAARTRLRLVFQVVEEAHGLRAAERSARKLPLPTRPLPDSVSSPLFSVSTGRECDALIQQLKLLEAQPKAAVEEPSTIGELRERIRDHLDAQRRRAENRTPLTPEEVARATAAAVAAVA